MTADRLPTSLRLTAADRALLERLQRHTGLSQVGVIRLGLAAAAKLLGVPVPTSPATAD